MRNPKLANRYAKALFDFAMEKGQLEEVRDDLQAIRSALRENADLQALLNSPVVAPNKKHSIFATLFQNNISETSFIFLDVIIRKKREPALHTICEEFQHFYNEHHRIKVVTVTTACPLSEAMVASIRTMLTEQTQYTIEIVQKVQPDIIGGIMINMDDFSFDASVVSKLNKLRNEFAHNMYQINF